VVCCCCLFVCLFPQIFRNGWERQFLCLVLCSSAILQLHDRQGGFVSAGKAKYMETQPPAPSLEQHITGTAFPPQTRTPGTPRAGSRRDSVGGGRMVGMRENITSSWMGVVGTGHTNRHCQPGKGRDLGLDPVSCCPPSLLTSPVSAVAPKQAPALQRGRWLSCFPSACRPFQPGWFALPLPF